MPTPPSASDSPTDAARDGRRAQARLAPLALPHGRSRMPLLQELALALLPTLVVLVVLFVIERFGHQRLLFASLASSAFLIYLDPTHGTNRIGTLFWAQSLGALMGVLGLVLFGSGYLGAALAMVAVIALMVTFDIVHPPAVSTALSFAFGAGHQSTVLLFGLALGMLVLLVLLERVMLRLLARLGPSDARTWQANAGPTHDTDRPSRGRHRD